MKVVCKLVDEDGTLVYDLSDWVNFAHLPNVGEEIYFDEYFEDEDKADSQWVVLSISHTYGKDSFGQPMYTQTIYIKPKE